MSHPGRHHSGLIRALDRSFVAQTAKFGDYLHRLCSEAARHEKPHLQWSLDHIPVAADHTASVDVRFSQLSEAEVAGVRVCLLEIFIKPATSKGSLRLEILIPFGLDTQANVSLLPDSVTDKGIYKAPTLPFDISCRDIVPDQSHLWSSATFRTRLLEALADSTKMKQLYHKGPADTISE
ncbi:MAG: hypothetical protein HY817_02485 [Candidatus Abawacabacteria bacterium]|nr:hypothetical protein [Candidatus Abawacabacteria bacterium]